MSSIRAFREAWMSGDPIDPDDWNDPDNRKARYDILWSYYELSTYRESVHNWASLYKASYGLYKYIRRLSGVPYRLGEFWKGHLWGGALDITKEGAGDQGTLPIVTEKDNLRPAIAQLWQDSNWLTRKDTVTLTGTVLGDVGIRVVDDVKREKVYLELLHPGLIADVELDPFGHVKGYTLEEERPHPEKSQPATYTEVCSRDGDDVVYQTYLDGREYAWPENDIDGEVNWEWRIPYTFVPMVLVKHNDVGLDWGWSELQPAMSKIQAIDDSISIRGDQLRKILHPLWLFSGVRQPGNNALSITRSRDSDERPEAGREEQDALYGPEGANARPLVAPLDIAGAVQHVAQIEQELCDDYPELSFDKLRLSGTVSGQALRVARQPVVVKVNQRRASYDGGLVRAMQMALAIGGWREYEGYQGLNLESYDKGDLDFTIGERPVFAVDPLDELEEEKVLWAAAEQAGKAGLPLRVFLKRQGWTDEDLKELDESPEMQARLAQMEMAVQGAQAMKQMGQG